jgi:hypothetical protein
MYVTAFPASCTCAEVYAHAPAVAVRAQCCSYLWHRCSGCCSCRAAWQGAILCVKLHRVQGTLCAADGHHRLCGFNFLRSFNTMHNELAWATQAHRAWASTRKRMGQRALRMGQRNGSTYVSCTAHGPVHAAHGPSKPQRMGQHMLILLA